MVKADDVWTLNWRAETTLARVDAWITRHGLELAPEKTASIIMKGLRKRVDIKFNIRGQEVIIGKAVKYLGVWLDSRGTYGEHTVQTVRKAERRTTALARILPNVGGPSMSRRLILLGVVHSTILYGAGIWHGVLRIKRYRAMLESAQRKILLRVVRAYRTVSAPAVQVLAGVPPIELLIEERREWENLDPQERTAAKKKTLRQEIVHRWQRRRESETERAQWTKILIPDLRRWVACAHRANIGYFLCQFLSGHGSFRVFTKRIGKDETDTCHYCGLSDSPDHTVLRCPRWETERVTIRSHVPDLRDPGRVVEKMIEGKEAWDEIAAAITSIMASKEREERVRQRDNAGTISPNFV